MEFLRGVAWLKFTPHKYRRLITQKECIRNAGHVKYNAHTTPLCYKHNILKLEDFYNVQVPTNYFDYLHKLLPENLSNPDIFYMNQDYHSCSTRQDSLPHAFYISSWAEISSSKSLFSSNHL